MLPDFQEDIQKIFNKGDFKDLDSLLEELILENLYQQHGTFKIQYLTEITKAYYYDLEEKKRFRN